jgi:hypothetical protein
MEQKRMDRITNNLLDEFAKEHGLESHPPVKQFEHFTAFSIVSHEYSESFDPSDVVVAGEDDTGIDGIAIIVNGSLVTSED